MEIAISVKIAHAPPPIFTVGQIHASFRQNIKVSEKFFVCLRKLRDIKKNVLICPGKILLTSLARQQFWGEILISN
jgi:hypothetical protein